MMKKNGRPKKGKSQPPAPGSPEASGRFHSPAELFGKDQWPLNGNDKARQTASTVLTAPSEWDFSAVKPAELEACLCYEFARESEVIATLAESYLERVRRGSEDEIVVAHCDLLERHTRCAFLLESLAPHFDLRETTWEKIKPAKVRAAAAAVFLQRSAFETAKPDVLAYRMALEGKFSNVKGLDERGMITERRYARGVKEWDGVDLHFESDAEIALVHIDWTKPVSEIKSACEKWLEAKINQRGGIVKTGRHANPESRARDLLRGLGAMRLLAHHPLKEAIAITKKKLGQPLYSGNEHRDDSRLTGRTAWSNGMKRARAYFKRTFRFEDAEPISWRFYKQRAET